MIERQRGQVLPLWLFGSMAMLVFLFFLLSYANTVTWQIRAQNAADAAAQAVLALQTQKFNQMEVILYTSAIEEYRIRYLLRGLLLAAHDQGGCPDDASCETAYEALRTQFLLATQRYTNDVIVAQHITSSLNFGTLDSDAHGLLTTLTSGSYCTSNQGGDCAFTYKIVDFSQRTARLETVEMDALGYLVPSYGSRTPAATVNADVFAPAQVEVAVCAVVPPLIPGFFNFTPQPFYAIGRAAATAVMVEQDWLQPGQVINPITSGVFQPNEEYASAPGAPYNWYDVDYGGNNDTAYSAFNGFAFELTSDEFSAQLGWWNSIPEAVYTGQQSSGTLGCQ